MIRNNHQPIFPGAHVPSTLLENNWPYAEIENENKRRALEGGKPVLSCNTWGKIPEPKEFMGAIEDAGGRLVSASRALDGEGTTRTYLWSCGVGCLRYQGDGYGNFQVSLVAEEVFERVVAIMRENIVDQQTGDEGHVYLLAQTQQGIRPYSLGNAAVPITRENYAKPVLKAYDETLAQMRSEDPFGRLVLLEGMPGTGKTYLVRHLAHELTDALFVYAPTAIVGSMDSPQLVPALLKLKATAENDNRVKRVVLVVEDADALVEKRTENSAGVLSTLLNLTSGMLGDLTNIYVVATYNNVSETRLDPAIVRDGRMMAHIQINELERDQGQLILRRLLDSSSAVYDGKPILSAVYKEARARGWKRASTTAMTG